MEGRTERLLSSAGLLKVEEAAMTVPVVADLDRVMLVGPVVDSVSCPDEATAVSGFVRWAVVDCAAIASDVC